MKVTRHQSETLLKGTEWECKKHRDLSLRLNSTEQIAVVSALIDWRDSKIGEHNQCEIDKVNDFINSVLLNW